MNRKEFLKAAAALTAGGRPAAAQTAAPSAARPNVVVLMSDQHRPDLLTCNGADLAPTPGIDRIASRGVRFRRAYCPYPVCAPSRMSFIMDISRASTAAAIVGTGTWS